MKTLLIGLLIFTAITAATHKWAIDQNHDRSVEALERIAFLESRLAKIAGEQK